MFWLILAVEVLWMVLDWANEVAVKKDQADASETSERQEPR